MDIPSERLNVPWTVWPGIVFAGDPVQVADATMPELTTAEPDEADVAPEREQATIVDGASPVFLRLTMQADTAAVPATHVTPTAVTFAVPDSVLKSPKEKPAIETPEISVMAIRMTVARTGEIALLLPNCLVFIFRQRV